MVCCVFTVFTLLIYGSKIKTPLRNISLERASLCLHEVDLGAVIVKTSPLTVGDRGPLRFGAPKWRQESRRRRGESAGHSPRSGSDHRPRHLQVYTPPPFFGTTHTHTSRNRLQCPSTTTSSSVNLSLTTQTNKRIGGSVWSTTRRQHRLFWSSNPRLTLSQVRWYGGGELKSHFESRHFIGIDFWHIVILYNCGWNFIVERLMLIYFPQQYELIKIATNRPLRVVKVS